MTPYHARFTWRRYAVITALMLSTACTSTTVRPGPRPFVFSKDSVAYANELVWEYGYDSTGHWAGWERQPPPSYALRCFVVARDARQFFYHARFDAALPKTTTTVYLHLVRQILDRDPATPSPALDRIVIPGYADLHEFSERWEFLLKSAGGGAWQSYLQRGNWRMVFPFSRASQEETATRLLSELRERRTPIVHVVTFPERTINHAVLVYNSNETPNRIAFETYDPNDPSRPTVLSFERATKTFHFPPTRYFAGGPVDVYEVYRSFFY